MVVVKKMRYPNWFPRPKAWLQAIILILALIPIVLIMRVTIVPFALLSRPFGDREFWAYTWLFLTGFCIPVFLLAHIHQLLWGEPSPKLPRWLPRLSSWGEGGYSWLVLVLCFAIGSSYAVTMGRPTTYEQFERQLQREAQIFGWLFIIISAYCYHLKTLIVNRFQSKSKETS